MQSHLFVNEWLFYLSNFYSLPFVILNAVKNLLQATSNYARPLCLSKNILRSSEWQILFIWALPPARAIRSYCTGLSHSPVSTSIANTKISFPPCHFDRREKSSSICIIRHARFRRFLPAVEMTIYYKRRILCKITLNPNKTKFPNFILLLNQSALTYKSMPYENPA